MQQIKHIAATLLLVILIYALAITLTTLQPLVYEQYIPRLYDTRELSPSTIRDNYTSLIDFCLNPLSSSLKLDGLKMSPEGEQHFVEVRQIFQSILLIGCLTLFALVPLMRHQLKHDNFKFLRSAGIAALILPAIIGGLMSINFSQSFYFFHKVFFRNDYWQFNPNTDPIILYLPADFFKSMGFIIIVMIVFCAAICLICYSLLSKKKLT